MGDISARQTTNQRLDSWKEIAAFLGRDERTVRRWEKERGLPVYRVPGGKGRIYSYTDELTTWLAGPQNSGAISPSTDTDAQPGADSTGARLTVVDGRNLDGRNLDGRNPDSRSAIAIEHPSSSDPSSAEASLQPHASHPRWRTAVLVMAPIFAVAILTLATLYRSPGLDSIAVLPFANAGGDANTDYLSDGITESLIDNLAHVPELRVRSRNSVFRYKGKDVDVQKMGNDLGVSALVSGRVVPRGDTIEVSAELTDVRDNTVIWGQHYSIKNSEIISLQQRIAGDIADKLRSKLSVAEKQQVTRQGTQNPEAYDMYLKGRYAWNKRTRPDLEAAISYFNQAIATDPSYALAYSGLADAYTSMPNFTGAPSKSFPKSNAAARKALELDPTLAHPHAVLGMNETQYDWDFAGGEAEFKKALELDPYDATAHQWYAESLDRIGGREPEALAEINRARQLDPQAPVIVRELGGILTTARQYDEAIAVCQKLAADNPTFAIAHDCLAKAYWAKRMYPQVVEEFKIQAQLSGNPEEVEYANALDQGFRSAGWKGALTQAIEIRQAQRRRTGYFSPEEIAQLYSDLGDKDQAFRWLDIAYQEHDWLLIGLKTFVPFDPLRSDPRYAELVRKVGLPK
jgi:TolB-like protein/Tfp pilus assembly protein PilF